MATLTIRNLPDEVHAALRVRAAKAGRSMEEEIRVMIADTLNKGTTKPDPDRAAAEMRALIRAANGGVLPQGVVDEFIAERRAEAAREEADADRQIAEYHRRKGLE